MRPLLKKHHRTKLTIASVLPVLAVVFVVTLMQRRVSVPVSNPSPINASFKSKKSGSALTSAGLGSEGKPKLKEWAASLPLAFEPNKGQGDPRIKFLASSSTSQLLLTSSSAILRLRDGQFTLKFPGTNPGASLNGIEQLPGYRNYLRGNDPAQWQTNVPTFRKVAYREIYPGINLTYYGRDRTLEYDFDVLPGANPAVIKLAFDHRVRPRISGDGDLVLRAGSAEVIERKPLVYQETNGERRMIEGRYVLLKNREIALALGEYDHSRTLVIDPTLVYSTYFGGSGDDLGSSVAVDSGNNVYIAGTTSSVNFPTHGPAFPNSAGLSDIFVTKIDSTGGNIVYSTYVGGSGLDRGDGLAVDAGGNAYVVGRVGDTSINFPTTAGALATTYRGGDFDGVVFKLNAQGNALVYSTFL